MKFLKGFARRFATAFSILSIILVGGTWAATQFLTGTAGDPSVGSIVQMFVNGSGNATPVSPTAGLPVQGGGYDSGTSPVQTATPANASHAAGQSVGGLFSVPMLRIAGGGGLLEYIPVMSVGGDTPTLQVRAWDRKPTNSAFDCADNAAYADGSGSTGGTVGADQSHMLPGFPQSVTLAAPANTTGDTKTYGVITLLPPISVHNQDASPTADVFICLVATVTYTPGGAAYYVDAIGPQD
jgi:hypothetical protein